MAFELDRATEAGDKRITEAGDQRGVENLHGVAHDVGTFTFTGQSADLLVGLGGTIDVIAKQPKYSIPGTDGDDLPPRTIPPFKLDSMSREGLIRS